MALSSRSYVKPIVPSNRFPVGVKWLLISTVCVFVLQTILGVSRVGSAGFQNFALNPSQIVQSFAIWQLVTYLFLHAGPMQLLWNMLALWMFGAELERTWGTRRFLRFYFVSGLIAAVIVVVAAYLLGGANVPVMSGASGAVCAILAAYGVLFPDQTILFGFLIPMKTKYFVMIIAALILYQSFVAVAGGQGATAVLADLGGLVAGYLLLQGRTLRGRVSQPAMAGYKDWKLRRAKRKFEVYLRKKDSDRDRWVH